MRICQCPKCKTIIRDEPIWRPAKMHNPSGDIDIARIDDVQVWLPKIAEQFKLVRGKQAVIEGIFAYYIGKRGVWVRRIAAEILRDCGLKAFNPPYETSGHNKLSNQVFGRKQKSASQEE